MPMGSRYGVRVEPTVENAPGYENLGHFFESRSQLDRALGMRATTRDDWERTTSRTRKKIAQRVSLLLLCAQEISPFMPTAHSVGRWLLTEQPRLDGKTPASVLAAEKTDGYDRVIWASGRETEIERHREALMAAH